MCWVWSNEERKKSPAKGGDTKWNEFIWKTEAKARSFCTLESKVRVQSFLLEIIKKMLEGLKQLCDMIRSACKILLDAFGRPEPGAH